MQKLVMAKYKFLTIIFLISETKWASLIKILTWHTQRRRAQCLYTQQIFIIENNKIC